MPKSKLVVLEENIILQFSDRSSKKLLPIAANSLLCSLLLNKAGEEIPRLLSFPYFPVF
jgi:hypothetical protein